MRRGFEMRLLLGDDMKQVSLGGVPISKIEETIALLFSIGAVMDDDGNWYEVDAVAFIAEEDEPFVAVVCKDDGGGGGGKDAEEIVPGAEGPGEDATDGDDDVQAREKPGVKGMDLAELQERMAKARLN